MGVSMGMLCSAGCFEPTKALLFGIPFGCFMAIFFSKETTDKESSTEQLSSDQDLVLNQSFLPLYLNTFGLFMFMSLMYILKLNYKGFDFNLAVATCAVMLFIHLVRIASYPAQIIIGQRLIVVRKNFLGLGWDKVYDLSEAKAIKLGWTGAVKIKFKLGKRFVIPKSQHQWFSNLPQFESADQTQRHISGIKIINWLEHKRKIAHDVNAKAELQRLKSIPRRRLSVAFVVFSALLGLFILAAPIFVSSQISVLKIERTNEKHRIFYKDVQNAFWLFDNPSKKMFETEWKTECDQNLNYACRLLSYLRVLEGDQVDALSLAKKSCSHRDPYSCFNVILNEEATEMDIKLAEFQIGEICNMPEHSDKEYCRCLGQKEIASDKTCQKLR